MKEGPTLDPYHNEALHIAYFLIHYKVGEYEKALTAADRLKMLAIYWDHMQKAAALARLGRQKQAQAEIDEMLRLKPEFRQAPRRHIGMLVLDKKLVEEILAGLESAGLPPVKDNVQIYKSQAE